MEPLENLNLYHDYAEKLSASKKSVKEDDALRFSFEAQKEITNELKALKDKDFHSSVVQGLFVIGLVTFLLHIVFIGWWIGILGLVVGAVFFVVGRILITHHLKQVNSVSIEIEQGRLLESKNLENIRLYNLSIIDLKLFRYKMMMILATVLTPLLFLAANEIIVGKNSILHYGLAIVIGSFFWMIYFYGNIDLLKNLRNKTATT